jgi:predicted nuclease of predicted toxin-antitoxin system
MKILIDMNLSPTWVSILEEAGYKATHWSFVGPYIKMGSSLAISHYFISSILLTILLTVV